MVKMERIAYFGGTFDPVHNGHLNVARALLKKFALDRLYFLPAYHAPHKPDRPPTSGYHRFAMLCLATEGFPDIYVSTLELEKGRSRYTIETLPELAAAHPGARTFFVMGADSWADIRTWRDWENVLLSSDHIVVTRPGYPIGSDHVTQAVRERIIDLRGRPNAELDDDIVNKHIYLTDAAVYDASATELRDDLSDGRLDRTDDIPPSVANYIEKYELYR
ncbi:MAG: nicotinate (nicotinamide) nucleotide adenylyltransferase [Chloracidobacterium sp.]|nr:nicotinate (nicotinamide) nucleotide adenylyltransferase [Chloracidobacterium sp.]